MPRNLIICMKLNLLYEMKWTFKNLSIISCPYKLIKLTLLFSLRDSNLDSCVPGLRSQIPLGRLWVFRGPELLSMLLRTW